MTVSVIQGIVLPALSWTLAVWSILALGRIPSYHLWKPAIASTEWGHWLACGALCLAAAGFFVGGSTRAVVPALIAAGLFASPAIRALRLATRAKAEIDQTFPLSTTRCLTRPSRRSALSVLRLPHIAIPTVERSCFVYRESEGRRLTLDLYRAKQVAGKSPVVIMIHGGSWNSGSSAQLSGMNRYLAAEGYAVAAINYRLAPEFKFPAPLDDVTEALSYLDHHADRFGIDPTRVALLGRSSGGHLALMAAYTLGIKAIRGVVALYAPTDMRWSWVRPSPKRIMDSNAVLKQFLGGTLGQVPEIFDRASPIRFVSSHSPPTLLIHGRKDMLVSPLQSRRLAAELKRANVRHFHLELPWGNHGMDANLAGPSGQMTLYAVERFFASVLQ